MNEDLMGRRIKMKRTELGLTMEMLGDILGVGKSAVNKWEKGKVKNIKRSTIAQMANLFDVNPVWLMGLDGGEIASYEPEIPTLKYVDHFKLEDLTLTEEERDIIHKYRTDYYFQKVIKALNGYEDSIPKADIPITVKPGKTDKDLFKLQSKSQHIPYLGDNISVKKVSKVRKTKDEIV